MELTAQASTGQGQTGAAYSVTVAARHPANYGTGVTSGTAPRFAVIGPLARHRMPQQRAVRG